MLEKKELKGRFKPADYYRLWVGDSGNKSTIQVWYTTDEGNKLYYRYEHLRPEVALYMVNLLRYEKPIFIDPESGDLEVTYEPIGEGE